MCVVVACEYFAESRQSRCHRDGIGVVGTAVEHLVLRDEIHHGFRCAESCQRQASADRFGQADHVRLQAEVFRGATPAEFRTGLYFIEDQQCAVQVAELPKSFQEARLWHTQADIHHDRFENNGCDFSGVLLESVCDGVQIIKASDEDIG